MKTPTAQDGAPARKRTRAQPLPGEVVGRRCLGPCAHCGVLVLGRLWKDGAYVDLMPRLTPIEGKEHVCATADNGQEAQRE